MAKPALSSAVGDIMQQRWIDLDAAYQLLCRLSLNDTNDSHIYVSLAGLQHLFFESMRSGQFGLATVSNRITVNINYDSFDHPCRLSINPTGFAVRAQPKSMKCGSDRLKTPRTAL